MAPWKLAERYRRIGRTRACAQVAFPPCTNLHHVSPSVSPSYISRTYRLCRLKWCALSRAPARWVTRGTAINVRACMGREAARKNAGHWKWREQRYRCLAGTCGIDGETRGTLFHPPNSLNSRKLGSHVADRGVCPQRPGDTGHYAARHFSETDAEPPCAHAAVRFVCD